jgi:hypothetical protein
MGLAQADDERINMGSFAVIYVKIIDNKKDGIVVHGPIVSDIKESEPEASTEAKKLINETRNSTIIPRIYPISSITELETVMNEARSYFKTLYDNMVEAKEALGRPVHRRKRRNKIMKEAEEA